MNYSRKLFQKETTLNAILYILERLGGRADMHKVFKILYFADKMHLGKYGRSITHDTYIAMEYGPVPSITDDIVKAVRGDSYFAPYADDLRLYFEVVDRYQLRPLMAADMDCLSASDVECLDAAIKKCRELSFPELTHLSHGYAWSCSTRDQEIDIDNILREAGAEEEYIDYINVRIGTANAFQNAFQGGTAK